MANGKKVRSSKSSQRKTNTSASQSRAAKGPSKIQKRNIDKTKSSSPKELIDAGNLLRKASQSSRGSKSKKKVSFEDLDLSEIQRLTDKQLEEELAQTQTTAPRYWGLTSHSHQHPELPEYAPRDSSSTAESAQLPPPPNWGHFSRRSSMDITAPYRAAKVRRLFEEKVLSDTDKSAGIKGPPQGHTQSHDNIFDANFNLKKPTYSIFHPIAPLPSKPIALMLADLHEQPHVLTVGQISLMLQLIQDRIFGSEDNQGFVQRHFSFTLTRTQAAAWPLFQLKTHYVPLYMSTLFVADGSQYGWHNFFTKLESRQHLVSAILGEWFVQRIFKHTAFGFPKDLTDELEEKDREFLNYDAIVRSKERAKLITEWHNNPLIQHEIINTTLAAANGLAEELLSVLHPLLPPSLFNPLNHNDDSTDDIEDPYTKSRKIQDIPLWAEIKRELFDLILDCAALHKGIRASGETGLIVRMVPNQQKGSKFQPGAPIECVNREMCNQTCPQDPEEPAELRIKMTCWPRVEAIVPSGLDMAQMECYETEYRRDLMVKMHHERSLRINRQHFQSHGGHHARTRKQPRTATGGDGDYPSDSSSSDSSNNSHDHDGDNIDDDRFDWDDKDHLWPIVPDILQDNEGRNAGNIDPETGFENTVKRAAYITLYPTLCNAKVYCEWTPEPAPTGQSLPEAIEQARRTHAEHTRLRIEDLRIELWNTWAMYGGLAQWGLLTVAGVVGFCRLFNIPVHLRSILMKAARQVDGLIRAAASHSNMPVADVPGYLVSQAVDTLKELWKGLGPFGPALAEPFEALVVRPLNAVISPVKGQSGSDLKANRANMEKIANAMKESITNAEKRGKAAVQTASGLSEHGQAALANMTAALMASTSAVIAASNSRHAAPAGVDASTTDAMVGVESQSESSHTRPNAWAVITELFEQSQNLTQGMFRKDN